MKKEEQKPIVTAVPQPRGNTGALPARDKGIIGASPSKGGTVTVGKILPGKTVAKPPVTKLSKPPVKTVTKK